MSSVDDMVSVPLRASIALQSAVLAFRAPSLQKQRVQACRIFLLDCICFRLELLLSSSHDIAPNLHGSSGVISDPETRESKMKKS